MVYLILCNKYTELLLKTMSNNDNLKNFHGSEYSEGPWSSKEFSCCKLCKTKSNDSLRKHWANGLCRSCYRRLSPKHRQYNDEWSSKTKTRQQDSLKKAYKEDNIENVKFSDLDIETLLERYDFKCAYCRDSLQIFEHSKGTFLNIEYIKLESGLYELVPICKSCSCSKKNLQSDYDLKMWAMEYRISYPFKYIKPSIK